MGRSRDLTTAGRVLALTVFLFVPPCGDVQCASEASVSSLAATITHYGASLDDSIAAGRIGGTVLLTVKASRDGADCAG